MAMVPFPNAGQHDDEQHEVHTCIFLYVGALCCLFCGGICRIICGGLPSGLGTKQATKMKPNDFCLILAMNEFLMSVIFAFFLFFAKWT